MNIHHSGGPIKRTLRDTRAFTLIEVLVATAIAGIALGVLLAGISLGHRQAYRGAMATEAAKIAEYLLFMSQRDPDVLEKKDVELTGHPGWSYEAEVRDLVVRIDGEDHEAEDLEELIIRIYPPEDAPAFILTTWIKRPDAWILNP
ncbi:MAG: type II secretion system GspH family protein [Deltaproteobacteria bacterium]